MSAVVPALFQPRLRRRRLVGVLFQAACFLISLVALAVLALLLWQVWKQGAGLLRWEFLTHVQSNLEPADSGVVSAVWGTIWVILITAVVAVPVGVGAAVYLEEYAPHNRVTRFIHLNIANLAGVPSIVYGILGLALFVRWLEFDRTVLSGGLTLALLVLPVVIIATREALAAVPNSIRQAAYALGATRWQTVRSHVLPAAVPGIMTGVILAMSRAIGEAAPLLMIGAVSFITTVPTGPLYGGQFTVLPMQIYEWADRPEAEFQQLAAATILVLLGLLLTMNALAVGIRAWHQRRRLT